MTDFKPKSFWEKREGKAGILILGGLAAMLGGAVVINGVGPFINSALMLLATMMQNAITMTLSGAALALLLYLLFDPRWHRLEVAMLQSLCRKIAGIFVAVDPIGIMREYVSTAKKKLVQVRTQIGRLRGSIEEIATMIKENSAQINQNVRVVKAAQALKTDQDRSKYMKDVKLAQNDVGRLQDSNTSLQEILNKLTMLYNRLLKIEDAADFLVKDTEREIEMKIKKLKAIRRGYSAITSAMKLIKPDEDEMYLFNLANEQTAEEIAMKVGEIEHALNISEGFLNGMDLKNMAFEQAGLDLIDSWGKEESLLLGEKKLTLQQDGSQVKVGLEDAPVQEQAHQSFGNYFEKK